MYTYIYTQYMKRRKLNNEKQFSVKLFTGQSTSRASLQYKMTSLASLPPVEPESTGTECDTEHVMS